jgi:hypothetical protein
MVTRHAADVTKLVARDFHITHPMVTHCVVGVTKPVDHL